MTPSPNPHPIPRPIQTMSSIRGDDEVLALVEEMSSLHRGVDDDEDDEGIGGPRNDAEGDRGSDDGNLFSCGPPETRGSHPLDGSARLSPDADGNPSTFRVGDGKAGDVWNPNVRFPAPDDAGRRLGTNANTSVPTNPTVELARRRSHEKFKKKFHRIFSHVAGNVGSPVGNEKKSGGGGSSKNAATKDLWKDLPVHAIRERWHFTSKLDERDDARRKASSLDGESSRGRGGEDWNGTPTQTTGRIRSMLLAGRESGTVVDPILPATARRHEKGDGGKKREDRLTQKGKRRRLADNDKSNATNLLANEVKFQWKREHRRQNRGRNEDDDKELDEFFKSAKFRRKIAKLTREINDLAAEIEGEFWTELGRRATAEDDAAAAAARGGKGGKKRKKNVPKITFDDPTDFPMRRNDNREGNSVTVTYGGLSLKLNRPHYRKLRILFDRHAPRPPSDDRYAHENAFASAIFSLLARYDTLEGAGLQSALTYRAFDYLLTTFDCAMECFASPLNCRYERYCSAYEDTDAMFGSLGSFFDYDFKTRGGCYQANPPFVADFIESMVRKMDESLSEGGDDPADGDGSSERGKPLMFVVFVPAWTETSGWKSLRRSPHLTEHVLLSQKSDPHYYAEGTQHRRKGDRHRIASFDTSVFFLQNRMAKAKWKVTEGKVREMRIAFGSNPDVDDGGTKTIAEDAAEVAQSNRGGVAGTCDRATASSATGEREREKEVSSKSSLPRHGKDPFRKSVGGVPEADNSKSSRGQKKKGKKRKLVVDDNADGGRRQIEILESLFSANKNGDDGASSLETKEWESSTKRGGGRKRSHQKKKKKKNNPHRGMKD